MNYVIKDMFVNIVNCVLTDTFQYTNHEIMDTMENWKLYQYGTLINCAIMEYWKLYQYGILINFAIMDFPEHW